jgi:NADH-quinone oxidoreductase subunit K
MIGILNIYLKRNNPIITLITIEIILLSISLLLLNISLNIDDIRGFSLLFYIIIIGGIETTIGISILILIFQTI